jgi:hypothetical protein
LLGNFSITFAKIIRSILNGFPINKSGPVNVSVVPGRPVNVLQESKLVGKSFVESCPARFKLLGGILESLLDSSADNFKYLLKLGVGFDASDPLCAVSDGLLDGFLGSVPREELSFGSLDLGVSSSGPPGEESILHGLNEVR